MPMTGEQFEALVSRLEELAKRDPRGYRLRVAALALLAYFYILAVLFLLIALTVATVVVFLEAKGAYYLLFKLGLPLALLSFFICRSFWVRFSPPAGVLISASDSPRIFELVDELKVKLDCPKIEAVYLNADFNASVYSLPRFGFLGAHKHYLCLGLPLMQSLSPEQFRAVLAHEMGHLSGNHGKFGSWIYSVRTTSAQLLDVVRKQSALGNFVFRHFFEWYYPFFNAYSFVLIRQHEYEADKCAAEVTGPKTAALSLINSEIKNRYVDLKFWKELFKKVDSSPSPPSAPFHELSELMMRSKMDAESFKWYQQALRRRTTTSQSHPSLLDRIKAMSELDSAASIENLSEEELQSAWDLKTSAAQEYLQGKLNDLEQRMDLAWHHAYDQNWRSLHVERKEWRKQLAFFEEKEQSVPLSDDELLSKCQLYAQLKSPAETVQLLRKALERLPEEVSLHYNLGERLLAEGNLEGIDHLEKVMLLKPVYGHELCELIYQHLMDDGRVEQAKTYLEKIQRYKDQLHLAAKERAGLRAADNYIAHNLDEVQIKAIVQHFQSIPVIKRAFLVCKSVTTFSDRPFFIIIVDIQYPLFKLVDSDETKKIIRNLSKVVSMPSEGYVIALNWAPGNLKKSLKTIPNALIYTRK